MVDHTDIFLIVVVLRFYLVVYVCIYVGVYTHVSVSTFGDWKIVPDLKQLELQVVVSPQHRCWETNSVF